MSIEIYLGGLTPEAPMNDGGNYNRLKVLVISIEVARRAETVI